VETAAVRRIDYIRSRAYELARSGQHRDRAAIERALELEGFADAHMALQDPYVEAFLIGLCNHNQRPRPKLSSYLAPAPDTIPLQRRPQR
jgi:hypothetical protein